MVNNKPVVKFLYVTQGIYNTFSILPLMKFIEQIASILEGVVDGNPNVEV